jgi:hypothetical protein
MRTLSELREAERLVRQAESDGRVPLNADGRLRAEAGPAGIEMINGTDYLQLHPRSRPAAADNVVVSVGHRTTGNPRSVLLERSAAAGLYRWLGAWLADGWPGVPRRCGLFHREGQLTTWQCDGEPGHRQDHEGPAVGWDGRDGKPGRESWPLGAEERPRLDFDAWDREEAEWALSYAGRVEDMPGDKKNYLLGYLASAVLRRLERG